MTLLELVDQLHGLAVGGEFNGKKMTKKELKDLLSNAPIFIKKRAIYYINIFNLII